MQPQSLEARFERWRARGDGAALSDAFDALAPGLLRLAIHLVGDAAAAEDLVQQSFVTAMERAAMWDARRPLEPWLHGILANHARDLRKSARRRPEPDFDLERVLARESESPLEVASRRELSGELARAVDALEEPYRAAVLLRLRHGMEAADIAHVLGRSPGAVRVQLHRARELLRKALPAGIAGALVLISESARGLASVRNQVLEHAAQLAPVAAVSGGLLGGALAMKQVLVAAAVVLALLVASWWFVDAERAPGTALSRSSPAESTRTPALASSDPIAAPAPFDAATRVAAVAPATEEATATHTFRCRVVDGLTDAPIPGARVSFHAPRTTLWSELRARWPERFRSIATGGDRVHDWPWFEAQPTAAQRLDLALLASYEAPQDGEAPLAEGVSGADGAFEAAISHRLAFVVAAADGYAARGQPPVLVRDVHYTGADHRSIERTFRDDVLLVRLFRAQRVAGRVIDERGEPIARRVALRVEGVGPGDRIDDGVRLHRPVDSWTVVTEPDGSFALDVAATRVRIRCLETGWYVASASMHPVRKKRWSFSDHAVGTDEPLWVPLRREPSVVVVSAADGTPVRDYWIQVREFEIDDWPRGMLRRIRSEVGRAPVLDGEDIDGTGRTTPVRNFAIHVFAAGYAPASATMSDPRVAEDVVIRLEPGVCPVIEGRVVDAGRAVAGAEVLLQAASRVSWQCDSASAGFATRTDELGRFSIPAAPGAWIVTTEHAGRSQCRHVLVPAGAPVEIDLARDTVVEFVAEAEAGTDFTGVYASLASASSIFTESTSLDANGRARFGSLAPGRYTAQVGGSGGAYASESDAEFELAAGTTRTLRFRSAAQDPPRVFRVEVDGVTDLTGWTATAFGVGSETRIAADGRVELRFGAREPRVAVASPDERVFQFLAPAERSDETRLHVPLARGGYAGVLRRPGGVVAAGITVAVTFPPDVGGLESATVRSDRSGRFRLEGLPDDGRQLQLMDAWGAAGDGFSGLWFECAAAPSSPLREIVVELPATTPPGEKRLGRIEVRGSVRDAAGNTGVWLRALDEQDDGTLHVGTSARIEAGGTYRAQTIPAARHAAVLTGDRGAAVRVERTFTIPDGVTEFRQDLGEP